MNLTRGVWTKWFWCIWQSSAWVSVWLLPVEPFWYHDTLLYFFFMFFEALRGLIKVWLLSIIFEYTFFYSLIWIGNPGGWDSSSLWWRQIQFLPSVFKSLYHKQVFLPTQWCCMWNSNFEYFTIKPNMEANLISAQSWINSLCNLKHKIWSYEDKHSLVIYCAHYFLLTSITVENNN